MNRGTYVTIALLVLVVSIISAGCTALSGEENQKSLASAPDPETGRTSYDAGIGQGSYTPVPTHAPVVAGIDEAAGTGDAIEQKLVYTAQVSIEVPDVPAAVDSLKTIAAGKNGYIASSAFSTLYNDRRTATVVLRVPAKDFESVLEGVIATGTVTSSNTKGEDVTAEYVDLLAQKASYQNQLAQYNEIMKKSEKVEDIITVQEQIDRVRTSLDRLEGRMRYLDNRIDLATITVSLSEIVPVGGEPGHSFIRTINEGISGLVGMIDFLIVALFTLLPLIIIGVAVYGVYLWYQSKKATKGAVPPRPETPEKK